MGMRTAELDGAAARPASRHGSTRWIPLLAGFAAVGFAVGAHLFHGPVPASKTPVQQVVAFYRTHASGQVIGGMLLVLSAFSYLAFASLVRGAVQRAGGESAASTLGLAGAVLFAVGVAIIAGIGSALGDGPGRMDPLTIQTLSWLYNDLFGPMAVGVAGFSGTASPSSARRRSLRGSGGWASRLAPSA
jgi:hypothetical protein